MFRSNSAGQTTRYDRLPMLAADLVRRNVEVIVAFPGPAALAAKAATGTIPIVFHIGGDPVKLGLVASFNRPDGNLTGVSANSPPVSRQSVSACCTACCRRIPHRCSCRSAGHYDGRAVDSLRQTARELELRLVVSNVDVDRGDIELAFEGLTQARLDALLVSATSFSPIIATRSYFLAARYAVPAIYEDSYFVKAGGLISYGTDFPAVFDNWHLCGEDTGRREARRPAGAAADQVRIGHQPQTAKALGLTIPETLLATADEVIQ